jgi:hypothetical protein
LYFYYGIFIIMEYDLIVRVALVEDLTDHDFDNFDLGIGLLKNMENTYKLLKEQDLNIEIGKIDHTTSGYYGDDENFINQITMLTSNFPQNTFKVYYSTFDFEHLRVFTIKDHDVLDIKEIEIIEPCKTNDENITMHPDFGVNLSIRHEVTSYINHYYDFDFY